VEDLSALKYNYQGDAAAAAAMKASALETSFGECPVGVLRLVLILLVLWGCCGAAVVPSCFVVLIRTFE
jgi:hypothetical protein